MHLRLEQPEAREAQHFLVLGGRERERADDARLVAEQHDDVEVDDLAGVRAAGHEPPVARERVEARLEELAADVLVDEIDAAAVRDPHDLGGHVVRGVVDALVHAELARLGELLVAARVADHVRAGEMRQLHGRRADARADRVDQHGLAHLQLAAREEHVVRGAEGDLEGRGLDVRHRVGRAHEVALGDRGVLGVAARDR